MDSFIIISCSSFALNAEVHIIHTSIIPIFKFLLKIYYSCSHKTPMKWGITFVVSSQKDHKGTILSSRDHFERRDQGVCVCQDQYLFRREKLLKWLLKAFGSQNGPFYPPLRLVKIIATFKVAMLCTVADAQCKTRELCYVDISFFVAYAHYWNRARDAMLG